MPNIILQGFGSTPSIVTQGYSSATVVSGTTTPQWCHNLTSRAWVHTLTSRAWVHTLTSRAWQHQIDYIGCGGVAGETQSSIVDNLVSTWTMVEVSGTRFDHFGSNHLTSNNGVDRITGQVGYGAGFTYADLATLSRASNTDLQTGDVSFAFTCWAYIDEKSYFHFIISKDGSTAGQREYVLYYDKDIDRYCFLVFRATDTAVAATANNYGSVPLNTWLFIYCYHNSVTDTIGISINDGTVNTTATGGALQAASNGEFQIGGSARFPTQYTQSGGIDAVTFHKTRVLTTNEVTALYNAGAGLEYPF